MKILFYIIMSIAFLLVTFFGIGPVVFADGPVSERIITLVIVLVIYILLGWITIHFTKRQKS